MGTGLGRPCSPLARARAAAPTSGGGAAARRDRPIPRERSPAGADRRARPRGDDRRRIIGGARAKVCRAAPPRGLSRVVRADLRVRDELGAERCGAGRVLAGAQPQRGPRARSSLDVRTRPALRAGNGARADLRTRRLAARGRRAVGASSAAGRRHIAARAWSDRRVARRPPLGDDGVARRDSRSAQASHPEPHHAVRIRAELPPGLAWLEHEAAMLHVVARELAARPRDLGWARGARISRCTSWARAAGAVVRDGQGLGKSSSALREHPGLRRDDLTDGWMIGVVAVVRGERVGQDDAFALEVHLRARRRELDGASIHARDHSTERASLVTCALGQRRRLDEDLLVGDQAIFEASCARGASAGG